MTPSSPNILADLIRARFTIHGMVQGVGFRPFVFRLAKAHALAGHVLNARDGVRIEVEGSASSVEAFAHALETLPPPHARITRIVREAVRPEKVSGFAVLPSEHGATPSLRVPLDLATCPDCLAELQDPYDHRHGYPFINCTACGPRYTIIDTLPYDRGATTMRSFTLCKHCVAEYSDPADRRFHAEPVACPACGPHLSLWNAEGEPLAERDAALEGTVQALLAGQIAAVKGLGGYHLIVDATNADAVARLRERKKRPAKPFALMAASLADAGRLVDFDHAEAALLQSPAAPIVLAARRENAPVAEGVAPGCRELGVMLAYTPLHHLLLRRLGRPVVATSGNDGGEPILFGDRSAWMGLRTMADIFLGHNRQIRRPAEDSVVRVLDGAPQVLRLGRGLAPDVLPLAPGVAPDGPIVLTLGGHLKTAPVLLRGQEAILAPHVGDLETLAAEEAFARAIEDLQALHGCRAEAIACDLHPDYPTSHLAEAFGLPVVRVQHHAAHVASVVAEHGLTEPVLGFAWDGTGYGTDGTVWGGEALTMNACGWERVARLRPFPLPGGEQAIREPRRALLGLLHAMGRPDLLPAGLMDAGDGRRMEQMLAAGLNAPRTSSAGRLFDAVAAMLGFGGVCRYEGEPAMWLERLAREAPPAADSHAAYPLLVMEKDGIGPLEVDWEPMMLGLVEDLGKGLAPASLARKAHETLSAMIAAVADRLDAPVVALSGGCFQNRLLTERALDRLSASGRRTYINRRVPPGDGGIALGQALLARRVLAGG